MTKLATIYNLILSESDKIGIVTYLIPLVSSIIPALIETSQDYVYLGATLFQFDLYILSQP